MPPTTIRTPPSADDYTPLEDFQSRTPETFVGGKPILHCHLVGAKASIPKSQGGKLAVFPADAGASETNGTNGDAEEPVIERQVDVFVNSENFTIFSNAAESGVSIPYPSISIHAVKHIGRAETEEARTQAVWMQLEFSDGGNNDDDDQDSSFVELTIVPPPADSSEGAASPAVHLYEAIAACSNLHPDPHDDGEEGDDDYQDRIVFEGSAEHEALEGFTGVLHGAADGSLPPPMPGSGGWITAENVHEYFDEEGNWRGRDGDAGDAPQEEEEEGTTNGGAGRTRPHQEVDGGGEDANGEEAKRPRVD